MKQKVRLSVVAALAITAAGISSGTFAGQSVPDKKMGFFVTSVGSGKGADLGGLAGADQHCQALAQAVGTGKRTWHAYLSTSATGAAPALNARDRIGHGPWYNAKGILIARNVDELHEGNSVRSAIVMVFGTELVK